MDDLRSGIVLSMTCLAPPAAERPRTIAPVAELRAADAHMTDRPTRPIEALTAHRQRLVRAAVTGQLDVAQDRAEVAS